VSDRAPDGGGVARSWLASRVGLLLLGAIALLAGLTGSLVLLGVPMPPETAGLAAAHGLLMTLGFLGTLIALERAVAIGRWWAYLAPLAAGLGGLLLVLGKELPVTGIAFATAGALLVAIYVAFDRIERSLHGSVQATGAVAWLIGALLLVAGRPVPSIAPWLGAFLVLTVAGERLELSRILRPTTAIRRMFVAVAGVFIAGVTLTIVAPDPGLRIAGAGLIGLALWLGRNDLARRTVRATGVTRYIAVCLLLGYAWMAVAGAWWVAAGPVAAGPAYDAQLHALFLGFVISMVFGHAPVILPAVLRVPLPYHPVLYLPLALLHGALVLRILLGDLGRSGAAFQLGGVLNVTALLLFLGLAVVLAVRSGRAQRGAKRRRVAGRPVPKI
jgi:hypothetical protein